MKCKILSTLFLGVSFLSLAFGTSPEGITDKDYVEFNQAISEYVLIHEGGLLMVKANAEKSLSEGMFSKLNIFVDILNQDVFEGRLEPITSETLESLRPPLITCQCLLGCCTNGHCWIIWPNYIKKVMCQP